jgi:hypothetical protein
MKKHLIPEHNHLFSAKDKQKITKAHEDLQLSYVRQRNKNVCRVCNKKFINKQIKICHMKLHLTPDQIHLFSEEEIKLIEDTHAHRQVVKKSSYKKITHNEVNATNTVVTNTAFMYAPIPIPPIPSIDE